MRRATVLVVLLVSSGLVAASFGGTARQAKPPSLRAIIYAKKYEGRTWIWRARLDGSHSVRLARGDRPTISPDGRWVVFYRYFGKTRIERMQLLVVPTAGGKPRVVYSGRELYPSWLPDSSGLLVHAPAGAGLLLVDVVTGKARLVAPQVAGGASLDEGTVSSNGTTVFFERGCCDDKEDVFAVPLSGGEENQITTDGISGEPYAGPEFVAFYRFPRTRIPFQLWAMQPDGSDTRKLADVPYNPGPTFWTADGQTLVYTSLEIGFSAPTYGRIWVADVTSGSVKPLTLLQEGLVPLGLSDDGRLVLATRGCGGGGLMVTPQIGTIETIPIGGGKPHVLLHGPCHASWHA